MAPKLRLIHGGQSGVIQVRGHAFGARAPKRALVCIRCRTAYSTLVAVLKAPLCAPLKAVES